MAAMNEPTKKDLFQILKAMLMGGDKKYHYKLMMLNSHMEALAAAEMRTNQQFTPTEAIVAIKKTYAQYADENNKKDLSVDATFEMLMWENTADDAVGFTYRMTSTDGRTAVVQGLCFDVTARMAAIEDEDEAIEL